MQTRSKLGLLSLAAIFAAACSSPGGTADGGADGGPMPTDGGPDARMDGKVPDAGPCGMLPDISGMTDMTITVQEIKAGMQTPTPLAGADVRVEQANNACGGYIDGTTDAQGVAHIKVDTSKGPFDITAAKANYTAVSVLNQTGPLMTPIVTAATNTGASSFKTNTASGTIGGKVANGDKVMLDAYWWQTVVTTAGTFNTQFQSATMGQSPPLIVTGVEVDGTGKVVGAMQNTTMMSRPSSNITGFNMTFAAATFSTANVTVNWPAAGILKGSDITQVGDPVTDMHLGTGAIVVKENANPRGSMFVGVADTAIPTNNKSTVKIQAGTGGYAPDYWEASYRTVDTLVFIRSNKLTDGDMFNVGQINMFDAMGMTLDDTTFATDADMSYDATEFLLVSQDAMGNGYAAWTMLSAGPKLASHKIPHLPKNVKLADITGGGNPDGRIVVMQFQGGTTAPWSEYNKPVAVTVLKSIGALDPGSRP